MLESIKNQWHKLKLFDKAVILFFLILNVLIAIFHQNVDHWGFRFLIHSLDILAVLYLVPLLELKDNPLLHFLRYWYLPLNIMFIYWNVGSLIHLVFPGYFDHYIINGEVAVFGQLPNIWLQQYVNPLLTEMMQISYGFYWFVIPVGAGLFYFTRRYREYEYMLFYIFSTFFISYLLFILIPVSSPRFSIAGQITAPYKGLLLTGMLRKLVENSGLHGGAFPSSHVAVAVVVLYFVWHYFPRTGKYAFLPAVIALSLSTVYGQYHYVTDMLSGLLMGIIIGNIGLRHTLRKLGENHIPDKQLRSRKAGLPEKTPSG